MFTIAALARQKYSLLAKLPPLQQFFADPANFARYMPDFINAVENASGNSSLWTLKVDIPSGSPIVARLQMEQTQKGNQIIYQPVQAGAESIAITINLVAEDSDTSVDFAMELKVARKSGFDIHPLAGLMGEKTISKIVKTHAEELIAEFVQKAEQQAQKGSKKK